MKHNVVIALLFAVVLVAPFGCAGMYSRWHDLPRNVPRNDEALLEDAIAKWEDFVRRYPDGELSVRAQRVIKELYYSQAIAINTIPVYESFLRRYPQGEYADRARRELEGLHYNKAATTNTITAYQEFLKQYPAGEKASSARRAMINVYKSSGAISDDDADLLVRYNIQGSVDFQRSEIVRQRIEALRTMIFTKSGTQITSAIIEQLEEIFWLRMRESDTPASYEEYLSRYPNGAHVADARLRLKEKHQEVDRAWLTARRSDSLDAYVNFVRKTERADYLHKAAERILLKAVNDRRAVREALVSFEANEGTGKTVVVWLPENSMMVLSGTPETRIYVFRDPESPLVLTRDKTGLAYQSGRGVVIKVQNGEIVKIWSFRGD